ncbi:MAG TPA: chromosome partitioning protein ParB [Cyanobacteria bacterium UBA12227]|nr:chromosome partitioning protein ParB [Cyanobacteria bacterium UBA12227]
MRKKTPAVPVMRGVEDLISTDVKQPQTSVSIKAILVNPKQPRRWFDPDKMAQLAHSVRSHGILEPLLVRPLPDGSYQLIAGERRLRAAKEVGLTEVPIVSRELDDKQALSVAILENLQREDLNPVEEVEAILGLLSINLDVSIDEVKSILHEVANAKKRNVELKEDVSRSYSVIESTLAGIGRVSAESFRTSRLPLLNLPQDVLEALRQGKLEYTKARAIARVKNDGERADLLDKTISQDLSLTQIKELIQELQTNDTPQIPPEKVLSQRYSDIGKRLNASGVWKDGKKRKKVEKLLNDLEKLLLSEELA